MPICGVVLLGFVCPIRPASRALHLSIFRVNAVHEGLNQWFLELESFRLRRMLQRFDLGFEQHGAPE
jgi:hypothetical protein